MIDFLCPKAVLQEGEADLTVRELCQEIQCPLVLFPQLGKELTLSLLAAKRGTKDDMGDGPIRQWDGRGILAHTLRTPELTLGDVHVQAEGLEGVLEVL